jgi:hypothetical protein
MLALLPRTLHASRSGYGFSLDDLYNVFEYHNICFLFQLQESDDKKESDDDSVERPKDDSIVYADLDKSAMSEGMRPNVLIENEKSEYADITPQTKE